MSDHAHETEAASCCTEMLGFWDGAKDAVRVYILNGTDKIAECLMTAAGAVTYGRIASAKRYLDHDDINR